MTHILILYYSRHGSTLALAEQIARGVEEIQGAVALLRTVPEILVDGVKSGAIPETGAPFVTEDDLRTCDGLALGSPTRFGTMGAPLKHFLEHTTGLWISGALSGKPAIVFTSTASQHGGQEATLLSLMLPLLHHGMVLLGIPYTQPELNTTRRGGSPYGASHVSGPENSTRLADEETRLCRALGKRLALAAGALCPNGKRVIA